MKTIFDFFFGQKNEYIGLTSFKAKKEIIKPEIKKQAPEKTALTGLMRRVS